MPSRYIGNTNSFITANVLQKSEAANIIFPKVACTWYNSMWLKKKAAQIKCYKIYTVSSYFVK